ncbi:sigma-70 family RNA polymerase sigma factor [Lentzea sp. NPDC004782]|uniref:sigma-70 family RNA polymerase sigma factor n=1 Tax=Lentzea sp. NPDC004782 TaxID=3154458 RepID=UPI00339FDDA6
MRDIVDCARSTEFLYSRFRFQRDAVSDLHQSEQLLAQKGQRVISRCSCALAFGQQSPAQTDRNRGKAMDASTSHEDAASAIRRLYAEHGKMIVGYATKLTGDRHAAEDVWQETALRAWRNWDRLSQNPDTTRTWLVKVARNIVIDRRRARARRPVEFGGDLLSYLGTQAPDDITCLLERHVFMSVLNRLSPLHREVIAQLVLADRSIPQAALAMCVPEGTVRSRYHYALCALRRYLGVAVNCVEIGEAWEPAVPSTAEFAA